MPKSEIRFRNSAEMKPRGRFKSNDEKALSYDLLDPKERTRRRRPRIEREDETGKLRSLLSPRRALTSTGALRDLIRNYNQAKSLLFRLQLSVIGDGNKVKFTTPDENWNEKAQKWYNNKFAKNADARNRLNLHDFNALIFNSVIREHDCLMWFDRAGVFSKGKFFFWENDQIVNLKKKDWDILETKKEIADIVRGDEWDGDPDELKMESGLILSPIGLTIGYIVHSGRGLTEIDFDKATILPHGPAHLISKPWRLNQKRGVADLLTAAAGLIDNMEMLKSELQSGKTASRIAMAVNVEDSSEVALARSDNDVNEVTVESPDKTGNTQALKSFEEFTQGYIEYLDPEEKAEILESKRPSPNVKDYVTWNTVTAGASLGLPAFHSLMRAEASFSAVRGEQNLASSTFTFYQKFNERYVFDFEVNEAITFAISNELLPNNNDWKENFSFDHPKEKTLDENKKAKADTEEAQAGRKSLRTLLGPDWKKEVEQLATEKEFAKSKGLNLKSFLPDPQGKPNSNNLQEIGEAAIDLFEEFEGAEVIKDGEKFIIDDGEFVRA